MIVGPVGHTKMTEDRGYNLCKDEAFPKNTFSCTGDIKAQGGGCLIGPVCILEQDFLDVSVF